MGFLETIGSFFDSARGFFSSVSDAAPFVMSMILLFVVGVGTIATLYCVTQEKWAAAVVSGVITLLFFIRMAVT